MTGQLVYSTQGLWSRIRSPKLLHYTVSKRLIVRAREKYLRTAADHPKQLALQNNIPQLIVTRSRFRHKATELSSILSEKLSHHQIVNLFPSPPWLASSFCTNQVSSTIPGILDCDNAPALKSQKISYQVDYTIYTSSSVSAGARNGGVAAIISTDSPTQPTIVSTIKIKGRVFTSSYEEEITAIEAALQWIFTNANSVQTSFLICTDSQSLCEVLATLY